MTPIDVVCEEGHSNIVQHFIRHHRMPTELRMPPNTFEQWPRLSQFFQQNSTPSSCSHENLFDCQSFFTLATIICYINIEPYRVMNEETSVVPRSSVLILRRQNRRWLWLVADYICGGKETRHIFGI